MRNSEAFPSPWFDMASMEMPDDPKTALEFCEYIYDANPTVNMALRRIVAYFLTDIEVGSRSSQKNLSDDEREKWDDLMLNIGLLKFIYEMDLDRMVYGNSFASVLVPFRRFLACPKCKSEFRLRVMHDNPTFNFKFTSDFEFHATCPKCKSGSGYTGKWDVVDKTDDNPDNLILKRWSPHDIEIQHDAFTGRTAYVWRIPEEDKKAIREGRIFNLETVRQPVLDAIKTNSLFKFNDNVIFHQKESTLAGRLNRGWGISRLLTNFRQAWYVQVLHRYNESIALDYVIPFRIVTPEQASADGTSDPLKRQNLGNFASQMQRIFKKRRKDPASWFTMSYPVRYTTLGGDATQLAPRDLLDQGLDVLLNGLGTPVELYKGTLQMQAAPVSMRLFEATWNHLVYDNNAFLRWFADRVSKLMSWELVSAKHKRVTHSDDMQRHMALIELMMSGVVSQTSGLKSLGLEYRDELRKKTEEAKDEQEEQASLQEDMDQLAFAQQVAQGAPPMAGGGAGMPMDPAAMAAGGGSGGGGMPVDPTTGQPVSGGPMASMMSGPGMPQTPEDMMASAEAIAQDLLSRPAMQRQSELRSIAQKNKVMHDLVLAKMDDIRNQARSVGGMQLMQQEFGGG